MRPILVLFALLVPIHSAAAQRKQKEEPKPRSTVTKFERFEEVVEYMDAPAIVSSEARRKFLDTYISRLVAIKAAAKSAKITGELEPDEWVLEHIDGGKEKSKDLFTAKFRDEQRRTAALKKIDASLQMMLDDKAAIEKGDGVVLEKINLKADYGLLEQADLKEIRGELEQLWEVNKVLIVIMGLDLTKDGVPFGISQGSTVGDIYKFERDGNFTGLLKRAGNKEVEIDGVKQSFPAFEFLRRENWPAEEKRSGKRLILLSFDRYGLSVP